MSRDSTRRRRILQGLAAVAVSALAIGAVAADSGPTSPEQLVDATDATPRGMAAAVMEHIDIDGGTLVYVGGKHRWPDKPWSEISVSFGYRLGGQQVGFTVTAHADPSGWDDMDTCHRDVAEHMEWCDGSDLDDGTPTYRGFKKSPRGDLDDVNGKAELVAYFKVHAHSGHAGAMRRGGAVVVVTEGVGPVRDPSYSAGDLPISIETLRAIATDPAVGFLTTEEFNEQGKQIADFGND